MPFTCRTSSICCLCWSRSHLARRPPSTPRCDLEFRRDTRTDLNHGAVGCDALPTSAYICAAWFHSSDAADGWVQLCERDRRAPSHLGADVGSGVVAKGLAVEVAALRLVLGGEVGLNIDFYNRTTGTVIRYFYAKQTVGGRSTRLLRCL